MNNEDTQRAIHEYTDLRNAFYSTNVLHTEINKFRRCR